LAVEAHLSPSVTSFQVVGTRGVGRENLMGKGHTGWKALDVGQALGRSCRWS
jgi:hypothetical protein